MVELAPGKVLQGPWALELPVRVCKQLSGGGPGPGHAWDGLAVEEVYWIWVDSSSPILEGSKMPTAGRAWDEG